MAQADPGGVATGRGYTRASRVPATEMSRQEAEHSAGGGWRLRPVGVSERGRAHSGGCGVGEGREAAGVHPRGLPAEVAAVGPKPRCLALPSPVEAYPPRGSSTP